MCFFATYSRMVTGVAGEGKFSLIVQTTKTYLHHVGNFLFLSNRVPEVVIYVAIWRFDFRPYTHLYDGSIHTPVHTVHTCTHKCGPL